MLLGATLAVIGNETDSFRYAVVVGISDTDGTSVGSAVGVRLGDAEG